MHIGITYDLKADYKAEGYTDEAIAEFDQIDTIDAIAGALESLGHSTDRIGRGKSLVARLARGDRWDLVFNISEGMHGIGRETQVPALLDMYAIPYTFSDPVVLGVSLHKAFAKRVVRDCGLATARFLQVNALGDLETLGFDPPYFVKPLAEGTGVGIDAACVIGSRDELATVCGRLLQRFAQPVLLETFLPGREFTVGLLGTGDRAEAIGVLEVCLLDSAEPGVYSYLNKAEYEERVAYRLADPAEPVVQAAAELALASWRALECRDGGRVDVRCDANGVPHFLEVNPLAGLHPVHSDLPILAGRVGLSYEEIIARIVASAMERVQPAGSTLPCAS
jgi:D-alanine-D-alanine ligase